VKRLKEAQKRLKEKIGEKILKDVEKGENPYIEIPLRTLNNVIYDPKTGMLTLGEKSAKRFLFNIAHAKKFTQTLMVAAFCNQLLKENLHTSLRDMFYALKRTFPNSNENTFEEENESNAVLVDLEVALDVLREQLHLNADVRGRVVGNVVIKDGKDLINWAKLGSGGWAIPSNVEDIEFKKVDADFILCLPSFEEIVVRIDDLLSSVPIKDVYDAYLQGKIILVVSFDENMKPIFSKAILITKRKARADEKLYKIETRSGSHIFVSEDHKIPVVGLQGLSYKPAKEIREGEYVLEAKDISILSNKFENLKIDVIDFIVKNYPELLNKIRAYGPLIKEILSDVKADWRFKRSGAIYQELINSWKNHSSMPLSYYLKFEKDPVRRTEIKLYFKGSPRKNAIPAIIEVDANFAKVLGYYVAEGHVSNGIAFWTFGKHERSFQKELIKLLESVFEIKPRVYRNDTKYSSVQIMCGNKIVGFLLENLCGNRAENKFVPKIIFNCSDEIKKAFLESCIKGDGYIHNNIITISTVSSKLADQVRLLLRLLGIPSYKRITKNNRGFKEYQKLPLNVIGILEHHWNKTKIRTSHSLWDKAPIFYFSSEYVIKSSNYGYQMLNINANKPKINTDFIHPVAVRKVEPLNYDGDYFELVAVEPAHVFLHSSGIFTHNCVEKNAAFERLHEDKFWQKHNCILLTTQGQAARGARRLLQRLSTEFKLPVYVATDADSFGWYIYSVIKYGSISLAHVSERLGTPTAKFLGLTISDIDEFNLHNFTIKATEQDIKRAEELMNYEWFKSKDWQRELKLMVERKIKAELEALSGKGLKFMTEVYLPTKLKEKKFLD
jgi:DNA topoisomerase VI subunit A